MTYQAFLNSLKKQSDNRLFLICGENAHFKHESLKALLAHYDVDFQSLDVDRFDAKAKEEDIILACKTLSFLGNKRLVVAEDFQPLTATKQGGDRLLAYLEDLNDNTVLIFYFSQKPDKRKKLYKAIVSKGVVVEFGAPKAEDLVAWIIYAFANLGKTASRQVASALIERSGQDMTTLKGEIDKIASYVKTDEVKVKDVQKVASQTLEYNVYQIHDLLIKKQVKEALNLLNEVLETEKSPFGILGLIANKLRMMYKARTMMDANYPQEKAIKLIGGHPYAAKMAIKDAKAFTAEGLMLGINALAEKDYLYKTGQMDAGLSLGNTLMKIYGI